jgi:glycosyltransferase involved in cell wall biosynthesis
LLDASHALAVPSVHEGYGIVYVEAMGRAAAARYQKTPTWPETCRRIASFLDRIARHSSS